MTIAASVTNESSPATPNGKPVSDKITNPDSSIIPSTATEKQAQREAKYNKSRHDIHATLTAYGPNGKPTNDTGPDGKQNRPGRAERDWSSSRPNHNFVDAYISGPMEARRRLRLKQGSLNPRDLHTTFDYNAYREAEAILAAWDGRTKWTEKGVGTGCWQPLPASSCPDELITPKKDVQPRVEPSSVSVELTEAISKGTTKVTDKLLNISYEQYLADPIQELDNLKVAVFAHVRTGYYKAVDDLIKGGMMGFEEISYDFSAHVMRKLQAGKYPDHDGKLANWVAKCWPRYCSSYKQAFFKEQKNLVGVNTFEVRDEDKDERIECKIGYVDIRDVEEQQYRLENAGPYLKHTDTITALNRG